MNILTAIYAIYNIVDNVTAYNNMFSQTSNLEVVVKDEVARNWVQDKLRSNGTAIISV